MTFPLLDGSSVLETGIQGLESRRMNANPAEAEEAQ
jgi:hypothetical protein